MFRCTFIITLLLTLFVVNAQTNDQDSCGIYKSPILNKCEAEFFDSLNTTLSQKKEFNFVNKRMAFFDATKQITKEQYFAVIRNHRGPRGLDILSEKEKKETSYDVIAIINLKAYQKDYFIKKLKIKNIN